MSARKKIPVPVTAGIIFLALAGLSLRSLAFLRHYTSHLIHLNGGRGAAARVSLYRAMHFNNAPGLLKRESRDQVMDAVLLHAVRSGSAGEILDFTSAVFPRAGFQRRFGHNPWYRILTGQNIAPENWDRLDRAGFLMLADPRANPIIRRKLENPAHLPSAPWNRHLAALARLKGNHPLAALLAGGEDTPAPAILAGPELQSACAKRLLLFPGMSAEEFSRRWRCRSRNPVAGGAAERLKNGMILLAAPASPPGRKTILALRRGYALHPGSFLLEIHYLADPGSGRLELIAGRDKAALDNTAGKWVRRKIHFSASSGFPVKVTLRGGGLVVVAAIRLFHREPVGGGTP